jgi:hypothetical protein
VAEGEVVFLTGLAASSRLLVRGPGTANASVDQAGADEVAAFTPVLNAIK